MDDQAGVPEWVVTYGDMMSLLLTFFIMLVSLSDVNAEEKYRAILNSLYKKLGYDAAPLVPPGDNFPLNGVIATLDTLGSFTDDDNGYGGVRREGVPGQELHVYRTREGESRLAGQPVYFKPLAVGLTPEIAQQLITIAAELAGKPNKVVVRSYASPAALPPESRYADKIALTYDRGRSVFRFLVAQGVDYRRLRIDAMSDTQPPAHDGDTQRLRRDRVEVVILNAFAEEFVGPR